MYFNRSTTPTLKGSRFPHDKDYEEFDNRYGGIEGKPFTVWTQNNVYFPVCYDGAEWVASVSRNPGGDPTEHVGGG